MLTGFFLSGLSALRAQGGPLHFYRLPAQGCDFLFSSAYEKEVREDRVRFLEAAKRLSLTLGDLALPQRCEIIYTVNRFEMQSYLEEELGLDSTVAARAAGQGFYRQGVRSVAMVGQVAVPWSGRFFLSEYARQALLASLPPQGRHSAAWFVEGLAVALAWWAYHPDDPQQIETYFGAQFDARRPLKLSGLFYRQDFSRQVENHGTHVLAQSVLTAYYFSRRTRDFARGLGVLRLYSKEKNFEQAFERSSGLSLEKFENEIYQVYYPLFRRSR